MNWDAVTAGIEIEIPRSNQDALEGLNQILPFHVHDDGSLRQNSYSVGGVCVLPMTSSTGEDIICANMRANPRFGLELVSSPMAVADLRPKLRILAKHFQYIPKSPVASIHVHYDIAGQPWKYVQNLISWTYHLEAILFRLAAAGKIHRGASNDYRFCRPLSNPIGATWGRTNGPLIQLDALLAAKTSSEMAFHWGRLDRYCEDGRWNIPHYVGHRYHFVNLVSAFRIGTFEWRMFDPLYEYIDLFFEIGLAVHKLAAKGFPDFTPFTLGNGYNISAKEVSQILAVDIESLWGTEWSAPVVNTWPDPHTGAVSFNRANPITIAYDTGSENDPLYLR